MRRLVSGHEKADVTHLLGFFTEGRASRDICAQKDKNTLLQNIQISRILFARRLVSRGFLDFLRKLKLRASPSRKNSEDSAPKHLILTNFNSDFLSINKSRIR